MITTSSQTYDGLTPVSGGGSDAPLEAEAGAQVPTIHVISDSLGDTAADVALAASAQFEEGLVHIERLPKVTAIDQVRDYLDGHANPGSPTLVFYTIADRGLRDETADELHSRGIESLDILGPALNAIERLTGIEPRGKAGIIHETDARYFRRIEAMEFFMCHDDGRNVQDLSQADIVLVGVSRTSKTPLSMYLSCHGYKVANVPLAKGVTPPEELFQVDRFRIFGLLSTPEVLSKLRYERLGTAEAREVAGSYADPGYIADELEEARALMRKLGCIVIHTNGRAVEETAQIVLSYFNPAEARWKAKQKAGAADGQ